LEDIGKQTTDELYLKGVERLSEFVKNINDEDGLIAEYATRFATIFLNVSPNDTAPHIHPFESVYLSADKLVMQDQRDEVVEFYAKYGLGVDQNFKEPEDHIAAELSFLCSLNGQIANECSENINMDIVADKLEGHQKFMEQHLLRWVHLMGIDLKKADENGFYSLLVDITMGFIRIDYKFLKDLIEYVKK
jgi:TorA maturation chaperone TorD